MYKECKTTNELEGNVKKELNTYRDAFLITTFAVLKLLSQAWLTSPGIYKFHHFMKSLKKLIVVSTLNTVSKISVIFQYIGQKHASLQLVVHNW